MLHISQEKSNFNPNPISKFIVVIILGGTIVHPIPAWTEFGLVIMLSIFFGLSGHVKDGIKGIIFFLLLFKIPSIDGLQSLPVFIKLCLSILFVARMFYLPFFAGKYLIKTSDVGSILSSMDKIKIPKAISIPIAVMFRFFPSFQEEKKNIKMAMKIRGISFRNPIAYLEYIAVPLLIVCSNIADDIAKAAEVKCIENPIAKTRYIEVKTRPIDGLFLGAVGLVLLGGFIW